MPHRTDKDLGLSAAGNAVEKKLPCTLVNCRKDFTQHRCLLLREIGILLGQRFNRAIRRTLDFPFILRNVRLLG